MLRASKINDALSSIDIRDTYYQFNNIAFSEKERILN